MYKLTIVSFVAIVLLGSVCVHAQKDTSEGVLDRFADNDSTKNHVDVLDRFAKNYWQKNHEKSTTQDTSEGTSEVPNLNVLDDPGSSSLKADFPEDYSICRSTGARCLK